jgi:hypothetical protein
MSLAFIAAFGRVIQLGGFGEITSLMNLFLEVAVESARVFIFLYALGLGSTRIGAFRVKRLFTDKDKRKLVWSAAIQKFKKHPLSISLNLIVFLFAAWAAII